MAPDHNLLFTGSANHIVAIWNLENYEKISELPPINDWIINLTFFSNTFGDYLFVGSGVFDSRIYLFNISQLSKPKLCEMF